MHDLIVFSVIGAIGILVQSFFGFAGSLTAIPLFAIFFPISQVLPAYTLVMIVVDSWLVFEARGHVQWGRVSQILWGGFIGVPIGAYGLRHLSIHAIQIIVSVVTCTFALLFLLRIRMNLQGNRRTRFTVGLLSGFLQGCIGQAGPPLILYGTAREWDKNTFRSTLLTYFLCLFLVSIAAYSYLGLMSRNTWVLFAVGVLPGFMAANIGVHFKDRVSERFYRQAILTIILLVGVASLLRTLW